METPRPPIVVILGHVDHGKTSLLDYLRKSNVAAHEAGGITQSVRSFKIPQGTFIDTPGHAAFSGMRSRGSFLADVAILVVSSVDGVMPQTKESVDFIKQAGIPFIVAITKSDLDTQNPDRVKTQLTEIGVIVEDFGGEVPVVSISAKTGKGIPELLEMLELITSLNPPLSDPSSPSQSIVLESKLDSKKGPLAFVIVKNGTLSIGQPLFGSVPVGKIRALISSTGENLTVAPPSTPVEILGLTSVPEVGSTLTSAPVSISSKPSSTSKIGGDKAGSLNIILCADVAGSLEAIFVSLPSGVNVVSSHTGDVNETDITNAIASKARIVCFGSRIPNSVSKLAEVEKITIDNFSIIYELLDHLSKLVNSRVTETILGRSIISAEFKIGPDRVAGCKCVEGIISKQDKIRIVRGDKIISESKLKTLKSGKQDIDKVKSGTEFGAVFSPYVDFKLGDSIISYELHGQA